jgi:hypothetical protein
MGTKHPYFGRGDALRQTQIQLGQRKYASGGFKSHAKSKSPTKLKSASIPTGVSRPATSSGTSSASSSAMVNNIVPLAQKSTNSSGYVGGNFGSQVASGNTRQLLFADFLYEDLV